MKHTTEELILAAMVTDAAWEVRRNAMPRSATPEELAEWKKKNTVDKFVPQVLSTLSIVADQIKAVRHLV